MNAIYITGFMGAGKTTVGITLGEKLGLPVIDTDDVIIKNEQRSIESIFQDIGEDSFRQLETSVLQSLPTENVIITTGGGIILKDVNRNFMKKNGLVIFLHSSPETIYERLQGDSSRPLLAGDKQKEIKTRLKQRMDKYLEADYVIDTDQLSVDDIALKIIAYLDKK